MSVIRFLWLFIPVFISAQSKIDESKLKIFSPNEKSLDYNLAYTQNFFFGNFGLKQLMQAVNVNNQSVKTIKITAVRDSEKPLSIMELSYDKEGKLVQMKVMESFFGEDMTIDYKYRDGLIEQEIIRRKDGNRINQFYYSEGKMLIENYHQLLDVYSLNGKVLSKRTYQDGNLVFNDRMDGKCRQTIFRSETINKICFSNLDLNLPLTIEEYTMAENQKTNKPELKKVQTLEIKDTKVLNYSITSNGKEQYILELDDNQRIKKFNFLGNKAEHIAPVEFRFNYINH